MNCARCGGWLMHEADAFGSFLCCIWCGMTVEPTPRPLPLLNENPKGGRRIGTAEMPQKRRNDARRIKRYE